MIVQLELSPSVIELHKRLTTLEKELAVLMAQPGVDPTVPASITSEIRKKEIEIYTVQGDYQDAVFPASRIAIEKCLKQPA
ncbi:hypothetical protein [Vibrio parahaemolyticus]|jgi:predicted transcriptional regulator|uniref:hypothetical protein n=1 Tax=Vibrio parahaemolyticus TaxID=670 RepID=UPI0003F020AD|nr:hypothetical protein [Vibrio parahaemolyticus]EGQ7800851.1 hypothetical protein [Vibrio parahaemolyticus]EGQ8535969.1 hypothetical protein [Vibrio parahaemolyticus]EIZ4252505.1 hypothetical protein [Vibrio parahaemolyticus]EWM34556.1 hypothetical protein D043_5211 [Vibrio parahaemolyticus EKP-021]MBE3700968.1 hypothetical protein [Vibrio parahaemolyticus]